MIDLSMRVHHGGLFARKMNGTIDQAIQICQIEYQAEQGEVLMMIHYRKEIILESGTDPE
jgi:hypothetical protein